MPKLELFGSAACPHTREMRDWLEWRGDDFVEFDVETDSAARVRMRELTGGQSMVPVLVDDGKIVQIGWHGRGCVIAGE